MSNTTQQGITITETPIIIKIENSELIFNLNGTKLHIPTIENIKSIEAIKLFMDHVYKTGLNDGFQIAIKNK